MVLPQYRFGALCNLRSDFDYSGQVLLVALMPVGAEPNARQVAVIVYIKAGIFEPLDKPELAQLSWCLLLASGLRR